MRVFGCCLLLLLSFGCGYRFENFEDASALRTISVPYIKGDPEGQLTSELIRHLTSSGQFEYVRQGGALTLKVVIVGDINDKIGFRYDRKEKSGRLTKHLVPTENRRTLSAEVSLIDEASLEQLIKPTLVNASFDYDYVGSHSIRDLSFVTPSGQVVTSSSFSLGQLDSVEGAQDDVLTPLYRYLAQKIVDGIIQEKW